SGAPGAARRQGNAPAGPGFSPRRARDERRRRALLAATPGGDGRRCGDRPAGWKFAAHRRKRRDREKMDESLPPHSADVVAVYDHDLVDATLANAVRKSTAQIDKASVKDLKAGLAEVGAGLAG